MYTALSAALVGAVPMTLFFFGFRLVRRIFRRTLHFAIKPFVIVAMFVVLLTVLSAIGLH